MDKKCRSKVDNEITCICDNLEEIHGFNSLLEYKRFEKYVNNLVDAKNIKEVEVKERYSGSNIFIEKWFQCEKCFQKWRIVAPDVPFKGIWLKLR